MVKRLSIYDVCHEIVVVQTLKKKINSNYTELFNEEWINWWILIDAII